MGENETVTIDGVEIGCWPVTLIIPAEECIIVSLPGHRPEGAVWECALCDVQHVITNPIHTYAV